MSNATPIQGHYDTSSVFVAVIGRPNVGKSSLTNLLVGEKVAIVTSKPQTTRSRVVGIMSEPGAQVIFMDTPGLSQVRGRLSKTMIQAVWQSLGQADVIMPVLDAHLYIRHPEYLDRDLAPVAEALASDERPMVVVANKVDKLKKREVEPNLEVIRQTLELPPDTPLVPFSAEKGDGKTEVLSLLSQFFA